MDRKKLRKRYEKVISDYLNVFIEDNFDREASIMKISDDVFEVNDYFFNLDEIIFCVENHLENNILFQWYDYCLRIGMINREIKTPTLAEYVNGAKVLTEDKISSLEKLKQAVDEAEETLKKEIEVVTKITEQADNI